MRIIAFTGYSGAGKSETSMRINRLFGYPIIESRPILKKIARENGFQRARECIPAIGFERFFSEGRKRTVDIINSTNDFLKPDKVIIADLFDRKLFKYLKEKFEDKMNIISISATRRIREHRIMIRKKIDRISSIKETKFLDMLKKRCGIKKVISSGDLKLKNNNGIEEIVKKIKNYLSRGEIEGD